MPLSILFQSFITLLLYEGGGGRWKLMFFDTFNNVSVIYHSFAVGKVDQETHVIYDFQ